MISIRGLHKFFNKGYQNEIHVVNDITLDLPEQGMVAIYGKSGCGKTTLLNLIGGLDKYQDGSIEIDHRNIRTNTDVIRNKYIGYIFQNYNLHKTESCFDNVADALRLCGMSDESKIEERVHAALASVGMEKYVKRTPDTLSGGQQQRIAIARAIVKNPKIILADEPTGNLDEANTVMIMDLLKAISRDHLVLLVTHESNLVDYYCDKVIELADGKVVNVRENVTASGFVARDKNDIFLGELECRNISDRSTEIEYYGELPEVPIKLQIVNHSGKLYVKIGTDKVQVLDDTSEVKLRSGVFEEKVNNGEIEKNIDMSALPPFEGTRFGHLFSLASSIKSGYAANFKNRKRGKKLLRACMSLFSAILVLMSAVFGTSFADIVNARQSYNHNVFYVYTPDAEVSAKLNDAVGNSATGIDYVRLTANYPYGDDSIFFRTGTFETFEQYDYESNFRTNAVILDMSLTTDMRLVAGRRDNLALEEILISSKVADDLIKRSTLGYITEHEDLIGLVSGMFTVDGKYCRIAGVVDSDESAVYFTELAMAKYVRSGGVVPYTALASEYGIKTNAGEAVLVIKSRREGVEYPSVGDTIKIQGRDIKISAIKEWHYGYESWLESIGIKKVDEYSYFCDVVKSENPDISESSEDFGALIDKTMRERHFEYYDYYYSDIHGYYEDVYFFDSYNFELWMYLEKGVEIAKYTYMSDEYYKASVYKSIHGRYPTTDELEQVYYDLPYLHDEMDRYVLLYEDEFYSADHSSGIYINTYMVHEEDYIAFSKQIGETHPTAKDLEIEYEQIKPYGNAVFDNDISIDMYYGVAYYTVIHSYDPDATEAWIYSEFSDLVAPYSYYEAIVTPNQLFNNIISGQMDEIITSFITMALILILMSACMYFIMRSSLMNRIKEVGIYRAIGVSGKNLVFKFFIEAVVLTTLTTLIGYVLMSAFLKLCLGMSAEMSMIFYYPTWLAAAILGLLYAISLFFGTLPIVSLLRKTPSEILAKYDI